MSRLQKRNFPRQAELIPSLTIPKTAHGFILFLIGFTALSYQVAVTRVFSFILYDDFVFLALSAGVFGIGVGAIISPIFFQGKSSGPGLFPLLLFSLSLPISIYALPLLPGDHQHLYVWISLGLMTTPPFIIMGAIAARIFQVRPRKSGYLYAFDLTGAALGALLAIPGLNLGPFIYVTWMSLTLLFILTIYLFFTNRKKQQLSAIPILLSLFIYLFFFSANTLSTIEENLLRRDVPGKSLFTELSSGDYRIEKTLWHASGRIDLTARPQDDVKLIYIDASVPATMPQFSGDLTDPQITRWKKFVAYAPFVYGKVDKVLSIGSGAGLDCILSKMAGAREITAVEINPLLSKITRMESAYSGDPYSLPGVTLVIDEGRAFVRKSKEQYDLILFLLAQGNAAEAGGRVLTQNFLTTEEAFGDYYDRLNEGGRIAIAVHNAHRASRFLMSWAAMLEKRNISLPEAVQRFSMLSYPNAAYRFLLIFHKSPPTLQDMQKLKAFTNSTESQPIYIPQIFEEDKFLGGMAKGTISAAEFIRTSPDNIDIAPTTDDRPFQNDIYAGVFPTFANFVWTITALLFLVIGFFVIKERGLSKPASLSLRWAAYFSAIGIGYMVIEIILTRRLMLYLGYPTLSLSVVLSSLLLGSGLGALTSQKLFLKNNRFIPKGLFLLCPAIFLYFPMTHFILDGAMTQALWVRCLISSILIMIPAFFMGMPLPFGIHKLGETNTHWIPWMWGINGLAAVLGSSLAMIAALKWGMTVAIGIGALSYLVAGMAVRKAC